MPADCLYSRPASSSLAGERAPTLLCLGLLCPGMPRQARAHNSSICSSSFCAASSCAALPGVMRMDWSRSSTCLRGVVWCGETRQRCTPHVPTVQPALQGYVGHIQAISSTHHDGAALRPHHKVGEADVAVQHARAGATKQDGAEHEGRMSAPIRCKGHAWARHRQQASSGCTTWICSTCM